MSNTQPIEKRSVRQDGKIAVHSIFKTIQGEGPFCGFPCVFIRLAGCNLQCPGCDTDYTSNRQLMGPYEILAEVNELWRADNHKRGLVVVTGGEPFRQDCYEFCSILLASDYFVQFESNGTLPPPDLPFRIVPDYIYPSGAHLVISPKTGKLNELALAKACALKYVVKHNDVRKEDGLPLHALDHPANPYPARPPKGWDRPVYVQPMDSGNTLDNDFNDKEAIESCLKHGYTLQIQIHKIIGVE